MAKKNVEPIVPILQTCNLHPIKIVIIKKIKLSEAIVGVPDGETNILSSEADHDQNWRVKTHKTEQLTFN